MQTASAASSKGLSQAKNQGEMSPQNNAAPTPQ
jgi:hypothetical protein